MGFFTGAANTANQLNNIYQGAGQGVPWTTNAAAQGGGTVVPNDQQSYGGGGGGAAVAAGPAIDYNQVGLYDQAIGNTNAAINRLGTQLNSGSSQIDASYQNALNQLLAGKNQGERNYNENTQTTKTGFVSGKNTIGANAGQQLNSIQRLLGARGAGGSSAATISAPQSVARQATLQRNDLTNTFGANIKALDQNWNDYLTGYNNQVSSATSQRDQQKQQLQNQIEQNRANLLQQLAQLSQQRASALGGNPQAAAQPYIDQANAVLDRTANYTVAPINYQVQAYKAPDLSKYTTNQFAAPTAQGTPAANDYFSPSLTALLNKKQQSNTAATPVTS